MRARRHWPQIIHRLRDHHLTLTAPCLERDGRHAPQTHLREIFRRAEALEEDPAQEITGLAEYADHLFTDPRGL